MNTYALEVQKRFREDGFMVDVDVDDRCVMSAQGPAVVAGGPRIERGCVVLSFFAL